MGEFEPFTRRCSANVAYHSFQNFVLNFSTKMLYYANWFTVGDDRQY